MGRNPGVSAVVSALLGVWEGNGEGGYPTIEPFSYRETTKFVERKDHPALHYEQRTWRQTSDGEAVSHWETGFLRLHSDGTATMLNAQGGRAETMTGTWHSHEDKWQIDLTSAGYAGDERVISSTRSIQVSPNAISYEMLMKTTAHPELTLHLRADLATQS